MNSFFRELKQRRVYRAAIGYAVVAWLVVQIASTVLPTFQVPLWILQTLIVGVALGFPVALFLAWTFDVTAAGIEKTVEGGLTSRSAGYGWLLASAGLVIAAGVISGYWLWHPWRAAEQKKSGVPNGNVALANVPIPEKSIAVLPLENLSDDKDNAYFADGIQDDLLSSLAKIKDLKVISRSSVMGYRNIAARNLREIGQQLGVVHVLEGSVRRAANRVLVNVALIDTRDEHRVWSERYDRTLADSLTLQGELATEIAGALQATLDPAEKARVETKPTNNPDAYVLYLRAREYHTRATGLLQDYQTAEQLYGEALKLDPGFVLAHARLSETLSYIYLNFQPTSQIKDRARAEAEEALRLRPDSGEANLARALCLYWTEKDYEAALRELQVASAFLPSATEIDFYSGAIRRRQGRWAEALASMKRAAANDPRNALIAREILLTQCLVRDWAAAAREGERAVALAPDLPVLAVEKGYVDFWARGDLGPLRATLAAIPPGVDPDGEVTLARWDSALLARDFSGAQSAVAKAARDSFITPFGATLPKSFLLGCVALSQGDLTRAQPLLESARSSMETEARAFPSDPFRQAQLGLLYAFLGRKAEAIRQGRSAVELLPEARDSYFGPSLSGLLALIYARTGETDQALALIEHLLHTPGAVTQIFEGSITRSDLHHRWQWDSIRKDPRFEAILGRPEPVVTSR